MRKLCPSKVLTQIAALGFILLLILRIFTLVRERRDQQLAVEALEQAAQRMVAWCDGTANGSLSFLEARAELYPMAAEMYDAICGFASCGKIDPMGLKIYAAWTVETAILNPGESELPVIARRILIPAQDIMEACSERKITATLLNELREFQYSFALYSVLPDI